MGANGDGARQGEEERGVEGMSHPPIWSPRHQLLGRVDVLVPEGDAHLMRAGRVRDEGDRENRERRGRQLELSCHGCDESGRRPHDHERCGEEGRGGEPPPHVEPSVPPEEQQREEADHPEVQEDEGHRGRVHAASLHPNSTSSARYTAASAAA